MIAGGQEVVAYLSECGKCVRNGDWGDAAGGRGLAFLEEWPGSGGVGTYT